MYMNVEPIFLSQPSAKAESCGGFTLIELLAVIVAAALLVATLLPALAASHPNSQAFQCLNNMKQLQLASLLYAGDNSDLLPGNETHPFKDPANPIGMGGNNPDWVAGSLGTPPASAGDSPSGASTNIYLLGVSGNAVPGGGQLVGSLGGYTKSAEIYHCPADQSTAFGHLRVRSCSENGFVGTTSSEQNGRPDEVNYRYTIFHKTSDFVRLRSSDAFTFLDGSPATLRGGFFLVYPQTSAGIGDRPAVNHGRSSSFSFADGHAGLHEWQNTFLTGASGPATSSDPMWLAAHATVVLAQ
jgi:prepilin-type N-terminal cleavage/methylation domain-containing protein/prepilin-type processing-associated H-X9-DG protein